jgi:nucleoside-diphosphate-sugar epimerase
MVGPAPPETQESEAMTNPITVLVTGSDGYIGQLVCSLLQERGHHVVGLDTGYYREGWLYPVASDRLPLCINKDIRRVTADDLNGFDAIVHLAELSNDPLCQHDSDLTYEINYRGTLELARKSISAGISRFVYTSSCSVYGAGDGAGYKTEESVPSPQTAYALCKVLVERGVSELASDDFSPTFLRNATAYGPSPRMRFDLVLNNLAGYAWTEREIRMTSDGTPWRPLVHVRDIANAISCVLEAPRDVVHNQIFNVGSTSENYQVRDIAQIIAETFVECKLTFGNSDGDNRSYRVNFDKIHSMLPGFKCAEEARSAAREFLELFGRIDLSQEMFGFRAYTRLKQLKYLLRTGQLDKQFYWTPVSCGRKASLQEELV